MLKRVLCYVLAGLLGCFAGAAVAGMYSVEKVTGDAMEPQLEKGRYVIVDKLFYRLKGHTPKRGDMVAFYADVFCEDGEGRILIRRVIAAEDDAVEIRDNVVYVNDRVCSEYIGTPAAMEDMKRTVIDKGRVFVMSDDRRATMDSRNEAIGQIDYKACIGRVLAGRIESKGESNESSSQQQKGAT